VYCNHTKDQEVAAKAPRLLISSSNQKVARHPRFVVYSNHSKDQKVEKLKIQRYESNKGTKIIEGSKEQVRHQISINIGME